MTGGRCEPITRSENLHRLQGVGLRLPTNRIHRRKAGVEGSMPESRHSLMSHFDPQLPFSSAGSRHPETSQRPPLNRTLTMFPDVFITCLPAAHGP